MPHEYKFCYHPACFVVGLQWGSTEVLMMVLHVFMLQFQGSAVGLMALLHPSWSSALVCLYMYSFIRLHSGCHTCWRSVPQSPGCRGSCAAFQVEGYRAIGLLTTLGVRGRPVGLMSPSLNYPSGVVYCITDSRFAVQMMKGSELSTVCS